MFLLNKKIFLLVTCLAALGTQSYAEEAKKEPKSGCNNSTSTCGGCL